ncbi:MAG TPA: Calx-beta domain-containing protein [Thermoanaerobaculia bacterium]|nr:Calx-beta domain-containing protein [Thermoanaerobaculia bacterium]
MRRTSLWVLLCLVAPAALAQTVQFGAASLEVGEKSGSAHLILQRSGDLSAESRVLVEDYPFGFPRNATQGADYRLPAGITVVFPPGATMAAADVPIIDDDLFEGNESFWVSVRALSHATANFAFEVKIRDDDPATFLRVAAGSYPVGENGGSATVTILRSGNLAGTVTVANETRQDTATAGADYAAVRGTVVFAPGETSHAVTIPILQDSLAEGPERFSLRIASPVGALVEAGGFEAAVIIEDDEPFSTVSIVDPTQNVMESVGSATVRVIRTGAVERAASVRYYTEVPFCFVVCTDLAMNGEDYVATSGVLTFAPGETSKNVAIPIINDAQSERIEPVFFHIDRPDGGTIAPDFAAATINIVDDDGRPVAVRVAPARVREGAAAVVRVTCSGIVAGSVTLRYQTTAWGTATPGVDFTPVDGTLTFTAAEPTRTFTVPTIDDSLTEPPESVGFFLTPQGGNVTIVQPEDLLIDDDEPPAYVSIDDVTVVEGDVDAVFTICLSAPLSVPLNVGAVTVDRTAKVGADYLPASLFVTFFPGEQQKTFRVPILGDALSEGDETFAVTLVVQAPVPAMAKRNGVGTIKDDDASFSVADTAVTEGDGGVRDAVFTVRLSLPMTTPASVAYHTADGTALGGSDFEHVRGMLHFAPGETSKRVAVPVHGDTTPEADETFVFRMENAAGAPIARASARCLIVNDDPYFTTQAGLEYADGLLLDLYLPISGPAPHPLILWIDGDAPSPAVRETARGFAVAAIRRPAEIRDVKAATRWLRANAARFALDEHRFVAWGSGDGGTLAALLGATAGTLDDPAQGNPAVSSAVQGVIDFGGPGSDALLQAITPDDPPFLIVDRSADAAAPLYRALVAAGVPATLTIVDGLWLGGDAVDREVDAFLDAIASAPRRRSTRR